MKLCKVLVTTSAIFFSAQSTNGFTTNVGSVTATRIPPTPLTYLHASPEGEGKVVDTVLSEMHASKFSFRIVVSTFELMN